jgi:hypothetical protein
LFPMRVEFDAGIPTCPPLKEKVMDLAAMRQSSGSPRAAQQPGGAISPVMSKPDCLEEASDDRARRLCPFQKASSVATNPAR